MKFFYLVFLTFMFSFSAIAQNEYVRIVKDMDVLVPVEENPDSIIKLFKGEIFLKKDNEHIFYGVDGIVLEINSKNCSQFPPELVALEYAKDKYRYIKPLENKTKWVFNMAEIPKEYRPIYIFKNNATLKYNNKTYILDNDKFMNIDKKALQGSFRIAMKDVPSMVYYFDEVEKRLNERNSKEKNENPKTDEVIPPNNDLELLEKELETKDSLLTLYKDSISIQKGNTHNSEGKSNSSFQDWMQNTNTRILGLLTFLLLVLSIILLFVRPKDKSKDKEKQKKKTLGSIQQETEDKKKNKQKQIEDKKDKQQQIDDKKKNELTETVQKNLKSEFEKLLKNQKGEISQTNKQLFQELDKQVKGIENNINTNINEKIILLQENQIEILAILKQLNKEQTSPVIEEKDNSAIDENSSFESHSVSSYQITSNENKSFKQTVKPILDVLNQAVSNTREEADVKKGRNKVVNNIIQRFDQKDKLLENDGRRWSNIFKQIKDGYIKDEKINTLLKNENNSSKQEEIFSEWFFKDYLCDYTNNVLILLEEYRNKTSFANKQVRSSHDNDTFKIIRKIIEMMEQNMGVKIYYTPLFKKPEIDYKNRDEWDSNQLSNNYEKIYGKVKKEAVAEIKQFGMSGKYQTNSSKEKTILIIKE